MSRQEKCVTADLAGKPGRDLERWVTIRFSHVDAAGIVFFPRYIELLAENFGTLPIWSVPFAIFIEFFKPNHLGDRLRIACKHDETTNVWRFCGRMDESEYFSIRFLPTGDHRLDAGAHRPGASAYRTDPVLIGAWASGSDDVLQISRYYELISAAVEQWFEETLDLSYRKLHMERRNGIPTVAIKTRCRELPRVGDSVTMWIRPIEIGMRSFAFTTWLVRDNECLVESEQRIVFTELAADGFQSAALPDNLRGCLAAQLSLEDSDERLRYRSQRRD